MTPTSSSDTLVVPQHSDTYLSQWLTNPCRLGSGRHWLQVRDGLDPGAPDRRGSDKRTNSNTAGAGPPINEGDGTTIPIAPG